LLLEKELRNCLYLSGSSEAPIIALLTY